MPEYKIIMPSKPRIVEEVDNKGIFEIDGLYPGYRPSISNTPLLPTSSTTRGLEGIIILYSGIIILKN